MTNLFDKATSKEVQERIGRMMPESRGTMSPAQTLAHCSLGTETAFGDKKPPQKMVGRILGPVIKKMVFADDAPMRKNSPTVPIMIVKGDRDLQTEKTQLIGLIDRFTASGAACCTKHPHAFFGFLTPEQWAVLTYKHVDHHLRQFGA